MTKPYVPDQSLGDRLRTYREQAGLTQADVSRELGITAQAYSHYETGRITPPVNSLYNLAKLYGVPVENFLNLVVTYNINMDFARTAQSQSIDSPEEFDLFVEYMNNPQNRNKFKYLNRDERLLIYYYQLLDSQDKEDILDFMKLKYHKRPPQPNSQE